MTDPMPPWKVLSAEDLKDFKRKGLSADELKGLARESTEFRLGRVAAELGWGVLNAIAVVEALEAVMPFLDTATDGVYMTDPKSREPLEALDVALAVFRSRFPK